MDNPEVSLYYRHHFTTQLHLSEIADNIPWDTLAGQQIGFDIHIDQNRIYWASLAGTLRSIFYLEERREGLSEYIYTVQYWNHTFLGGISFEDRQAQQGILWALHSTIVARDPSAEVRTELPVHSFDSVDPTMSGHADPQ